ncbi:MAG: hypothetical protein R6T90_04080, partial [Dissulfuribacterales bacterium]
KHKILQSTSKKLFLLLFLILSIQSFSKETQALQKINFHGSPLINEFDFFQAISEIENSYDNESYSNKIFRSGRMSPPVILSINFRIGRLVFQSILCITLKGIAEAVAKPVIKGP